MFSKGPLIIFEHDALKFYILQSNMFFNNIRRNWLQDDVIQIFATRYLQSNNTFLTHDV